jgi:hypothetical protein
MMRDDRQNDSYRRNRKDCRGLWCDGGNQCPGCPRNHGIRSSYKRLFRRSIWNHYMRRERRQSRQQLRLSFFNGALS